MQKQKKSTCRICGKEFTPAWKHPNQIVCNDEACRKKYGAERTAEYAKKEKSTSRGRKKFAVKEQRRYRGKKAASLSNGHEIAPLNIATVKKLTLRSLYEEFCKLKCAFDGLLQIINETSFEQLTYEKCYEAGKEKIRKSENSADIG